MYFGELSEFMKYLILILESLLVVILSIIFFLLIHKTKFGKFKWIYQQIIIGVVFGGAAIFGTEMGIDIGSSIINVRDAAPLTAGLLFGGPAGMIAAVIGSLWRFISSYAFYKGHYAMVACCVATLLAGAYAWVLRKWFFEEKTPNFLFGFATAAIMEVIHFIILYLTHIKDPQTVLDIIYEITLVMIIANGVGVSLACLAMGLFENGFSIKVFRSREKTINSRIQLHLLILILVTGFTSTSFVVIIQNNYANETATSALDNNIIDVGAYISEKINNNAIDDTYIAAAYYNQFLEDEVPSHDAITLVRDNNLLFTDVNLVAVRTENGHEEGEILDSTNPSYIGLNVLNASDDSDDILHTSHMLTASNTYYEPDYTRHFETNFYDSGFFGKELMFSTYSLEDEYNIPGIYLQIITDVDTFYEAFYDVICYDIKEFTMYRRVYLNGYIIVFDKDFNIVSHVSYHKQDDSGFVPEEFSNPNNSYSMFDKSIYGVKSFYMYYETYTFYVVGVIPMTDVTVGRNMMIVVYSFMLTFIYASIFFATYILMKQLVVKNLRKINGTLNLIMQGDLNQKVDVKSSQEFIDLSRDINITVDTLKDFIKEAEERIDTELAFARTIQASSLPSVFPPFPDAKEFDIYATMNTAKEVGGDFYDFYFIDMDHLAFLVADVSGKGIPASMFMMESKALLKNTSASIKNIERVFDRVNESLSQGNEANMFVTCWMGIVDLKTGVVEFVNAGHNAPLVYHKKTGKWEYLNEKRDLVLAGLPNTKYHKQTIELKPGDKLYLYTDGVTEATRGDKVLYGEARLERYLNKFKNFDQYKLLAGIQKDIDKFVDGAPQFDDITMLVFDFKQVRK